MKAVVWDTEFTTWEGAMARNWSGENEYRELVQIAAKVIDFDNGDELAEMDILVKPVINPVVSDYFTDLTSVTQDQIEKDGLSFADAYQKFKDFVGDLPCFSYGMDCVILQEGCDLNDISYDLTCPFLNACVYFKNAGIDVRQYTSGTISKAFGIELDGHVHYAMHDVNSLTQALLAVHKKKQIIVG